MFSALSRIWFPLALVALFVLSLPGVALCFLTLIGQDGDINGWLQDNFQISYHLALAPWLAMILLMLPLFILLLYFLKLKRKPLQVPSTFLWKKSIEDLHVNSLFQWLRENILLVLQILIILVLIYSVLGLRFHGGASHGKHYILLIDNSASMSATDISPSRLEWAKQQALKEIDAAEDGDFGMVIVFNSKATTLQAYTGNKGKLREAVRSIEQTERPTRIEEALTLADSLANPVRSTEDAVVQPADVAKGQDREYVPLEGKGISTTVHLFSDGRFPRPSEASLNQLASKQTGKTALLGNLNLHYHSAGKKGPDSVNNVAIVGMNPVRHAGAKEKGDRDLQKMEVFVAVRNFRNAAVTVKLKLDIYAAGKLIHGDQRMLKLSKRVVKFAADDPDSDPKDEPGEPKSERDEPADPVFTLPPLDPRGNIVVHAYLDNHADDFPVDDSAWVAIGTLRKAKVLIVGPPNPVLGAFFEQPAAQRLATVERLSTEDLQTEKYRKKATGGDVDLVIFDRCAPWDEADMPQANTFFLDRPPPPWRRGDKTLRNPYLAVSKKDHSILRYLTTLWDVGVNEAFVFDLKKNLDEKAKPRFELPEGNAERRTLPSMTKLLEAGGGNPVLFTLPRGAHTDLVMTFPLVNEAGDLVTNWPLNPSFPLFFQNILYHLGNVDEGGRSVTVQPGEPHTIRPEAGVQWLQITPPAAKPLKLERGNRPDFVFADTDKVGVYRVQRDDGGSGSFTVNLLDSEESNIEPREQIRIGSERIASGEDRAMPREIWKWILLVAVVLLAAEWYIYNRRVAV